VYYTAQIVPFGAEITRAYTEDAGRRPPPQDFARRDPAAAKRA
jgi:hypothetical protein